MRKLFVASLFAMFASVALAVDIPAQLSISYVLPTTATDGLPLTGPLALTGINIYADVAAIPDAPTAAPCVVASATAVTANCTVTIPNGGTIHVRLSACNAGGCSVLTPEVTKVITMAVPGVPTSVVIAVTIKTS